MPNDNWTNDATSKADQRTKAPSVLRLGEEAEGTDAPKDDDLSMDTNARDAEQTEGSTADVQSEEGVEQGEAPVDQASWDDADRRETYAEELDEATTALKETEPTLYERLQDLADALVDGKTPLLHKDHVMVQREETLELIETLITYCEEGGVHVDDALIDRLSSDGHAGDADFMPLRHVKQRAKVIIGDATVQAETILADAKILAARLLQETEDAIEARYDEADKEINQRLSSTNEVSAKRLNESREELFNSRQQAVDILNRYMDKAEEDYQGYWERAEKSLLVSLQKSDATYAKVAETFARELAFVREDIDLIESILEDLKSNRPR